MSQELISGLDCQSPADLVLVNSPLRDYGIRPKDDYEVLPPLGLGSIASHAAEHGHNVGLLDAEHLGTPQSALVEVVNELTPRYAGINVLTPTRLEALRFAEGLNPDIPLIIGGPHATALTERTLREFSAVHPRVLLIRGEAETAVTAVLDGQSPHAIPGAFWIENGVVSYTPGLSTPTDLDSLPYLTRKFFPNDPSVDAHTNRRESRILTSRGCPFTCTFCAGSREVSDSLTRKRSPESVGGEIAALVADEGIQSVRFVDDLFISSEKRARSILEAAERNGVSRLFWDATGRANILAKFSPGTLDYLAQSGASEIAIGIESGSKRLREKINKKVNMQDILTSITVLTKRGIRVKGYFIIGLPTETKEETTNTIGLARDLTVRYPGAFRASVFIFRPYPGTMEWNDLIAQGYAEDDLLRMHADGSGERSKHEVLTELQFGEYTPEELSLVLSEYNQWQRDFLSQSGRQ